ncbi:MAG: hypothetical protein DRP71_06870 [Verrucomicrobia bacterium]|nr:MAG: hypothetical protein DRP71_06870 [Verrucomicrobiota bacterium]
MKSVIRERVVIRLNTTSEIFVYRAFFIAVLVFSLPGVSCFGGEPPSDLPDETVDCPAEGTQEGQPLEKSEDAGSSGEPEDPADTTADKEPQAGDEDVPAGEDVESEALVDRFRTGFKSRLDRSADWVDGLLGTDDFQDTPENTYGRVSANVYWQNREGFYVRGRFRVEVNLDNVNNRFNAMIGRGDPQDMMANRYQDSSRFASFYQGNENDEFLAGIGYTPDWASENQDFSIGGGVHLTWPPAPYINLNYRNRYVSKSEATMVYFYQTFYYRTDEGVGSTTTIEPTHLITEDFLIKWYNSFNVGEEAFGVRYESYLTLYQDLGRQRALAYEFGVFGETGRAIPLINYGGSVTYRQQMFREWLYGEVTVGMAWPREFPEWDRRGDLLLGFGVEFFFGDGR